MRHVSVMPVIDLSCSRANLLASCVRAQQARPTLAAPHAHNGSRHGTGRARRLRTRRRFPGDRRSPGAPPHLEDSRTHQSDAARRMVTAARGRQRRLAAAAMRLNPAAAGNTLECRGSDWMIIVARSSPRWLPLMAWAWWRNRGRSPDFAQAPRLHRRRSHRKLAGRRMQASIARRISEATDWDPRQHHPRRTRQVASCSSRQTPSARIRRAEWTTAARQIGKRLGLASAHPAGVHPTPTAHRLTKPFRNFCGGLSEIQ
jgi:hypothetical protein